MLLLLQQNLGMAWGTGAPVVEEEAPVVSFPHPAWSFRTGADQIALQRRANKEAARVRKKGKKRATAEVTRVFREVAQAMPEAAEEIVATPLSDDLAARDMRGLLDDTQRLRLLYLAREMMIERENDDLAILLLVA